MDSSKLAGATSGVSGAASIMGSWQVCHNICLGLIALLGAVGITLTGMPLFFLTKIAVPLWSAAVVLLGVTIYLYHTKRCISKNLLVLNTGLIVAGTPFLAEFQISFWIAGGLMVATGIGMYIKDRQDKRCCHE